MHCVVIGGGGFMGQAVVHELLRRGDTVTIGGLSGTIPFWVSANPNVKSTICDIRDFSMICRAIKGADEVYNMAGVLGTSELNEAVQKAITINIKGSVAVFQACRKQGIPKVFYPTKPNVWLNTYTITKETTDRFAEMLTCEKTRIVRLRWFNVYGPGQHMKPVRKVVPTFCLCARFKLPLPIWGSGLNTTDQVYSEDVAKWSVEATRAGLSDKIYDLGTGEALTALQVAEAINEISGNSAGVQHYPMRSGETENTRLVADVGLLQIALQSEKKKLGFTPWMEGLRKTYEYYTKKVSRGEAQAALEFHGLWT